MRKENKSLLESYRGRPCLICLSEETVAHHIKTKGSGGDDVETNLMPLCFTHHREVHDHGLTMFAAKYTNARTFLESTGWEFDEFLYRWIRQESLF